MENTCETRHSGTLWQEWYPQEMDAWFTVSGDADDFIFYGEETSGHSEK